MASFQSPISLLEPKHEKLWPGLENKNYKFHNRVKCFGLEFYVGCVITIKNKTGNYDYVRIHCMYEDSNESIFCKKIRAIVEPFITPDQLEYKENTIKFHPYAEIIQQSDIPYKNIEIERFHKKHIIIFAVTTEDPTTIINEHSPKHEDPVVVCRYIMTKNNNSVTFESSVLSACINGYQLFQYETPPKHYKITSIDNDTGLKLKLKRKSVLTPEGKNNEDCIPYVLLEKLNIKTDDKVTNPKSSNNSKRKQNFNHKTYNDTEDVIFEKVIKKNDDINKNNAIKETRNRKQDLKSHKMYSNRNVNVDEVVILKNDGNGNEINDIKSPKRVIMVDSESENEIVVKTPKKIRKFVVNDNDDLIDSITNKMKTKLGIVTPKKVETPSKTKKRLTSLENIDETTSKTPRKHNENNDTTVRANSDVENDENDENVFKRRSSRIINMKEVVREPVCKSIRRSTRMSLRNTQTILIDSSSDEETRKKPVKRLLEKQFLDNIGSNTTTPKKSTPRLRTLNLTPRVENRIDVLTPTKNRFELARRQLTTSLRPGCLPCREREFDDITTFLNSKLKDNSGGCMYISGVPGTGKTATVCEIMKVLTNDKKKHNFKFISVNALSLTEPKQVYVEIVKQISQKTLRWDEALTYIRNYFIKQKHVLHVLLIDELDKLCTRKQDVVYNLLDLPSGSKTPLVVITIANTMDLPERLLSNKVNSRLGLTRLTFRPYKHKELIDIVKTRLSNYSKVFRNEALEFVARKVAAVSGDARRALAICSRAMEIAEAAGIKEITMDIVNKTLDDMASSPKVLAIKSCSKLDKMILQALTQEVSRTGNDEVPFVNVVQLLEGICILNNIVIPSVSLLLRCCHRLSFFRLIIMQEGKQDVGNTILLNISADDIHFALKDESIQ